MLPSDIREISMKQDNYVMPPPVRPKANDNPDSYPMASLYVGDLHPEVTEAQLFEKFSSSGPVLSIRVCRDAFTRRSLRYAYVNFQNHTDAERALDTMNFDLMNNKPMRIMWCQRDSAVRRSNTGNVFIKNLDKRIDVKSMYDTFSLFGTILSCKIATDEEGQSRGYGFIHFKDEDASKKAIDRVNGMLLDGRMVSVEKFIPRDARQSHNNAECFTNNFVKNFGDEFTDEILAELFGKYGTITSSAVMKDAEGKSKGFGFVAYTKHEHAVSAINAMNDYELPISKLRITVCRAQTKVERQAQLRRQFEAQRSERIKRCQGVNLYVKNFDESIDDNALRSHFESFGKITSAKVMCDEAGRSKGFGFVCFERPDDATKAVVDMNNKMVCSKPLYVALAQRKEDRKAQLASQYMQRLAAMRMQNPGQVAGTMYSPAQGGFFVQSAIGGQRPFMNPMQGGPIRNQAPRWGNLGNQYHVPNYFFQNRSGRGGQRPPRMMMQGRPGNMNPPMPPPQQFHQGTGPRVRQIQVPQGMHQYKINSTALAEASERERKQMIGEVLYERISHLVEPDYVGKITGMMLELDNGELLEILENEQLLKGKISIASTVLRGSQAVGEIAQ